MYTVSRYGNVTWESYSPILLSLVMSCRDLDVLPPQNGQRTGIEFDMGTWAVSFSCNQGYKLIGNSSLTCQADGQWSGIVPICKGMCLLFLFTSVVSMVVKFGEMFWVTCVSLLNFDFTFFVFFAKLFSCLGLSFVS